MENILLIDSNSCCNALLKLRCWLILAKYGSSKLEIVKQTTQDAALIEFETRVYLKNRFLCSSYDKYIEFMQNVYHNTMKLISEYICTPDWSIFYGNDGDSIWHLSSVIKNETAAASLAFTAESHAACLQLFYNIEQKIFSIIDAWSDATYIFSNYISASLSVLFVERFKNFLLKYENYPNKTDITWICNDIMSNDFEKDDDLKPEVKQSLWFLTEHLNMHFFDEENEIINSKRCPTEEELITKLANWLFKESTSEFRINTKRLLRFHDDEYTDVHVFNKERLSAYLNVPIADLELQMTTSLSNRLQMNINLSDGPHYYVDNIHGSVLTELQSLHVIQNNHYMEDNRDSTNTVNEIMKIHDFDAIDSVLHDSGDTQFNVKISDIKVELGELYATDFSNMKIQTNDNVDEMTESTSFINSHNSGETISLPKLQIIGRHEAKKLSKSHNIHTMVQHKKRGRPRKIDECNHSLPKNGQHKYSPENVMDCSTWISDNFFEVPGNKPAIDRARLYELYTNYCLLKLCTPVDRALFGKIIRKVFPELKSRRLIQNQVLKYHYVGLKPRFQELEQALLYTDSSNNPQEILLSYVQSDD